jgi:hypothetical protein
VKGKTRASAQSPHLAWRRPCECNICSRYVDTSWTRAIRETVQMGDVRGCGRCSFITGRAKGAGDPVPFAPRTAHCSTVRIQAPSTRVHTQRAQNAGYQRNSWVGPKRSATNTLSGPCSTKNTSTIWRPFSIFQYPPQSELLRSTFSSVDYDDRISKIPSGPKLNMSGLNALK